MNAASGAVLLLAVFLANLPFLTTRRLGLWPAPKGLAWQVLELLLGYAVWLLLASVLEARLGQRAPQAWAFYAVTACLFLVMAFPGFIYRHLGRHAPAAA
jgi:predicted permease